jgi:hypothetical protein
VCQFSGSYLDGKYLKQRDHKTPQGPNLRMPAINTVIIEVHENIKETGQRTKFSYEA